MSNDVSKAGVVVTLRLPPANIVSKAAVVIPLRLPEANIVSKANVVVVLRPGASEVDEGFVSIIW